MGTGQPVNVGPVGSGMRYQILLPVLARYLWPCEYSVLFLLGHRFFDLHVARYSRMARGFLTRTTCKKVWQKSYTSGHCLGPSAGAGHCQGSIQLRIQQQTLSRSILHVRMNCPYSWPHQSQWSMTITWTWTGFLGNVIPAWTILQYWGASAGHEP